MILLYKRNLTLASQEFVKTPEFLVWFFLIFLLTALFVIFSCPLWKALKQLKQYFIAKKLDIALSVIIFFILLSLPYWIPLYVVPFSISFPLAYHKIKMLLLSTIGFITTGSPAVIGIFLIHVALKSTFANLKPTQKHISQYHLFQKHLQLFVSTLGIVVGLLTLATGALRKTLISFGTSPKDFPSSIVLAYGLYFTMLIALIYFPVYNSLLKAGRQLCDIFFPMPLPDSKSWAETYSNRKKLEEFLQLQKSTPQRFQSSIAIAAPLISGIASVLLG